MSEEKSHRPMLPHNKMRYVTAALLLIIAIVLVVVLLTLTSEPIEVELPEAAKVIIDEAILVDYEIDSVENPDTTTEWMRNQDITKDDVYCVTLDHYVDVMIPRFTASGATERWETYIYVLRMPGDNWEIFGGPPSLIDCPSDLF